MALRGKPALQSVRIPSLQVRVSVATLVAETSGSVEKVQNLSGLYGGQ